MGHKISVYRDIQTKGVELPRGIYAASGLYRRPKTQVNKIAASKENYSRIENDPEQVLVREAVNQLART
jgi:hypothetical protein